MRVLGRKTTPPKTRSFATVPETLPARSTAEDADRGRRGEAVATERFQGAFPSKRRLSVDRPIHARIPLDYRAKRILSALWAAKRFATCLARMVTATKSWRLSSFVVMTAGPVTTPSD